MLRTLLYLLVLALAACGQKGQLYLPAEAPAEESVTAPALPEAAAEEEKKDDRSDPRARA